MTLSALGIFSAAGAGGGVSLSDYELISTQVLGTATPSVTFSSLGDYSSTYKHLQIRFTGRTATSQYAQEFTLRFNGVSSSSYSWHFLRGDGSSVASTGGSTQNAMFVGQFSSALSATNNYGSGVVDILDAYSTTKNKTVRGLSGIVDSGLTRMTFYSGLFQSTNATSSLTIYSQNFSDNINAGSRFSLYGLKG
jgi:hypothetical protein